MINITSMYTTVLGIWGSAFGIILNTLFNDNQRNQLAFEKDLQDELGENYNSPT